MKYTGAEYKKKIKNELGFIAGLVLGMSIVKMRRGVTEQELKKDINDFKQKFAIATGVILYNYSKVIDGVVDNTVIRNFKRVKKLKNVSKTILKDDLLKDARAKVKKFKSISNNDLRAVMSNSSNYWETQFKRLNATLKSNEALTKLAEGQAGIRDELNNALIKRIKGERNKILINGKKWDSEKYYRMLLRTKTSEFETATTLANAKKYNTDLIKISAHNTICDICLDYEGKVFSMDGNTPGFPVADDLPPYHPNCRHFMTIMFSDVMKASGSYEKEKAFSNNEIDKPPNNPNFIPRKERGNNV